MTKIFNKFKNPVLTYFWSIFPIFWAKKKIFSEKFGSVTHNFICVSSTMPKCRTNKWYNYKKTPGQTEGRNDGQTLFYRILPATSGGPISKRLPENIYYEKCRYLSRKFIVESCLSIKLHLLLLYCWLHEI